MSDRPESSMEEIDQQAADWFTLLRSSEKTVETGKQLNAWLGASPDHARAYRQIENLWQSLGELASSPELEAIRDAAEAESVAAQPEPGSNVPGSWLEGLVAFLLSPRAGFVAVASVVVVLAMVLLPQPTEDIVVNQHQSPTGEIRTLELADGSASVALAPESIIKAWSTATERHVELVSGEAFFEVESDPARPFFVLADSTLVKVTGTKFDVRKGVGLVSVAVLEGEVNVTDSEQAVAVASAQKTVVLRQGEQVIKPRDKAFKPVTKVTEAELGAWRTGRLVYRDCELLDLISDANRYFDGTISLSEESLADLRVTATIRTDQVAHLPDMLAQSLPITVQTYAGNKIVISRASVDAD